MTKILVVEDDEAMCEAIRYGLKRGGWEAAFCRNGNEALDRVLQEAFDLVILDRMLPGMDGLELLTQIRREKVSIRVLMVTAMGALGDRVAGLDAGADDYLAKPFEMEEMLARIRSLCRRSPVIEDEEVSAGDLRLDVQRRLLTGPSASCVLSGREAQVTEALLRNPRQVLTRSVLFGCVWGQQAGVESGNLDSYIHYLRRRMEGVGSACRIKTVHGVGYRFEPKGERGEC